VLQRATSDPALAKMAAEMFKLTAEANTHLLAANSSLLVALTLVT
jgi:hypothetical protein